ncbi:MAG: 2-hydroxy-3-oxopropionate reductase [Anaerolineae bacterium]|nr:2-hydroxy-3-oxopropionate reductase [Anaerolineae bacterium]
METIGFIGLGLMGRPMAENLLRTGYPLVVHNRSREAVDALAAQGARAAHSPREVAEQCDVVITMLPDPDTVARVIGGTDGVLADARVGALIIDMSTSQPQLARDLAARGARQGVSVLDAPVSGGQVGAQQATLSIMVGGDAAAFERALPLFQCMGKNIMLVGGAGAGQVVKAANQIIVGLTIEAVAEALAFVEKSGVDPAKAREVMMGGFATSRVLDLHGKRMVDRNFTPGANAWMHLKDLNISLEMAQANGANLPVTAQVAKMYNELIARGFGNDDHSALWRVVAEDWEKRA